MTLRFPIAAASGLVVLIACGKGPQEPMTTGASGTATLVFRHGVVSGFEREFRALLDRFEARNPRIRVREEVLPWDSGQQHQLYAINLESRSDAFDVMGLDIVWVAEFGRAGWARDLSSDWPQAQRALFLDGTVEAATYSGRPYAVPWFTDCGLLYYRKDLLAKHGLRVPQTWQELSRTARSVLDREGDPRLAGFVWQGRQYEGLICDTLEYIHSNRVRLLDGQGRWVADPAKSAQALRFMFDLVNVHKVSPPLVLAADEETARHIFGNGEAVFMRNWPYAFGIYSKPGAVIEGKFGVAPLPHFEAGQSAPTLGGWFLAVNGYSRHPQEAFALVRYMTSEEVQRELFLKLSYLPTRKALYRDPALLRKAPQLEVFGRALATARPRPVTPFYPSVAEILQSEFSAVLAGLRRPEDAVRNIEVQLRPILTERP